MIDKDDEWRIMRRIVLSLATVIVALLSTVQWVMWVRTDSLRQADRDLSERTSKLEGQIHTVLDLRIAR